MFFKQLLKTFTLTKNMSTIAINETSVLVDKIGKITTIGINRPEKRNCVDSTTAKLLKRAILNFEEDDSSLTAVLYGIGGNFCSGYDLQEIADVGDSHCRSYSEFSILPLKKMIRKPMVASLSGYTVAGGLELALLCDLRVMEETAVLGLYERRFGIPISDGATVRLPALIGLSRALDLILTGKSLTAKEAFEWGLANRIVACGTGLGQALQLATCLEKFPQDCLISDRDSAYNAAYTQVYEELLKYEKQNANSVKLKSIVEGAKKFLSGIGRHGKSYNLKEKDCNDWEKEFNEFVKSKL
ncbi:probable enoyl-CoA hydratase echA8 [Euwallacea similis]|uniref:probable enoyl-CoA hydratase echA8 n=1 Tax=Euwallacea similis TaxID=1736056 RepID=UPI00344FAA6E